MQKGLLQFGHQLSCKKRLRVPWPRDVALWDQPAPPRATDLQRRSSLGHGGGNHGSHESLVKFGGF